MSLELELREVIERELQAIRTPRSEDPECPQRVGDPSICAGAVLTCDYPNSLTALVRVYGEGAACCSRETCAVLSFLGESE